ncbi:MAG: HAD hydrolase family protein [Pseudomonadota bacterium]
MVDLDGTILQHGQRVVSPEISAIFSILQNRKQLIVNSARHPEAIRTALGPKVNFASSIALNGAVLFCDNWNSPYVLNGFKPKEVSSIIRYAKETLVSLCVFTLDSWYVSQFDNFIMEESVITGMTPISIDLLNTQEFDCYKITAISENEKLDLFKCKLEAFPNIISDLSKSNYLEISPRGIDKSTLIPKFISSIGEKRNSVKIHFWGDSYNDIPCALYADYVYSYSHSPEELKELSNKIFNINNGVDILKFLKEILSSWTIRPL